ncbi:hypothetical protein M0L20_18015 [Spirosoma sp. RP8]|uniref:YD repeat-containing protein n=1 Tax=Spirosoma liriopis TaxID=2937440 RepID=A0ABT0HNL1_9BACT|nr:hypothetical protein [Spirosoma liriopis]MCK8493768.1 hypothetical protein [Spirosoma liriopis]
MITHRLLTCFIGVSIALGLTTCSDHHIPDVTPGSTASRLRVKTLTLELPNNVAKVSSFRYDGQGRLSSIFTYQTPDSTVSELETSLYQYDAQNRLTQLRRQAILYPRGNPFNPTEQYTFTYNSAGQLSGLAYLNGFTLGFTYNSANQLIRSGRQFSISGLSITGSNSFSYTGNNLTRLTDNRTLPLRGPSGNTESVSDYTHDDKVNPFYGLYVIPAPYPSGFVNMANSPNLVATYFGGLENVLNLSKNNVVRQVTNTTTTIGSQVSTGTATVAYQYEYNTANLPSVRRMSVDNVMTQTLRFDYESY